MGRILGRVAHADKLFASPKGRVGNASTAEIPETSRAALKRGNANFAYVNFMSATDKSDSDSDKFGHSYFRDAPTVSSDLILMLRDDLDPGPPGRPLEPLGFKFWRIPPGYPTIK